MKLVKYIALVWVLIVAIQLCAEGFIANTLVHNFGNKSTSIKQVCNSIATGKRQVVSSWHEKKNKWGGQRVHRAGHGTIDCTVTLMFDDNADHDITCSPIQLFYVAQHSEWVEAYKLHPGDLLQTESGKTIHLAGLSLHKQEATVYALRIRKNHTFYVGYYRVLTHNKHIPLLPLALMARIGIAFGSGAVAGGTAGSFLGPVTFAGGITIGGVVCALATCAAIGSELYHYRMQIGTHQIEQILPSLPRGGPLYVHQSQALQPSSKSAALVNMPVPQEDIREQTGCGDIKLHEVMHTGGCGAKPTDNASSKLPNGCGGKPAELEIPDSGCLVYSFAQESSKQKQKERYAGPWVRNWDEFFETCPVGQQHKTKFKNTGRRNPKDNAPIYKVIEDVPGAEMFEKGNLLAPDRMHGDHFEMWDADGNWIGVANVDGSKNDVKSEAEDNPNSRSIKRLVR